MIRSYIGLEQSFYLIVTEVKWQHVIRYFIETLYFFQLKFILTFSYFSCETYITKVNLSLISVKSRYSQSLISSSTQNEVLSEIRQSVDDFKLKTSKMSAEDPKLKMMQKVLDGLAPVLHKDDCDLGELLTLASMAMETWLDTR